MKRCLILILILLWGCSLQKGKQLSPELQNLKNVTVYSNKIKPAKSIFFQKSTVYGGTENHLIDPRGDVAVDDSGRVFIANNREMGIDVFSPESDYIGLIGRMGRGPGEFLSVNSLQIINNHLYVFDSLQFRVSVFALNDLTESKTVYLGRNRVDFRALGKAYPRIDKLYVRNNGTYIAEYIENSSQITSKWQNTDMIGHLYLLNKKGLIMSKIFDFKTGTRTLVGLLVVPVKPFFGDGMIVLAGDNRIFYAGPDHLLVKIYSQGGIYRHSFYYPLEKIPLTQQSAVKAGVRKLYTKNMNLMQLPQYWPVLTRLKFDEQGRLWIATTVKDMKVYQWWVLKPNGQLIARFTWPRDKPIQVVKNGYLYVTVKNKKGIACIVKYKIEMKKNKR